MKSLLSKSIFSFCLSFLAFSAFCSPNPANLELEQSFESAESFIDEQLGDLHTINQIVIDENLNYQELAAKYPAIHESSRLSASVADGLFESNPGAPLEIHGFWWGLVLSCLGIGIVYFIMDDDEDRKEHLKYAVIGCLISGLLGGGLWWQVF